MILTITLTSDLAMFYNSKSLKKGDEVSVHLDDASVHLATVISIKRPDGDTMIIEAEISYL